MDYSNYSQEVARLLRKFDEWAESKGRIDYPTYDNTRVLGIAQAKIELHRIADTVEREFAEFQAGKV